MVIVRWLMSDGRREMARERDDLRELSRVKWLAWDSQKEMVKVGRPGWDGCSEKAEEIWLECDCQVRERWLERNGWREMVRERWLERDDRREMVREEWSQKEMIGERWLANIYLFAKWIQSPLNVRVLFICLRIDRWVLVRKSMGYELYSLLVVTCMLLASL